MKLSSAQKAFTVFVVDDGRISTQQAKRVMGPRICLEEVVESDDSRIAHLRKESVRERRSHKQRDQARRERG